MKTILVTITIIFLASSQLISQYRLVGAPCEGCEAVLEFGDRNLSSVDTLPEFNSEGVQIKVSGTVYELDGKTPAEGVILYVYQTNEEGIYPKKGDETGWAKRHGYIRNWIKTDEQGNYTFFTQKPMFYGSEPAHIHLTILESNGKYYYVQDFLFEGDRNLSSRQINNASPRGGSNGIISYVMEDGILTGERDIILGKNVPRYE